jgi:hypothetical protein
MLICDNCKKADLPARTANGEIHVVCQGEYRFSVDLCPACWEKVADILKVKSKEKAE